MNLRRMTAAAAAAFVVTGGWHVSGYAGIDAASADLAAPFPALVRALWLAYGAHLLLAGIAVLALAFQRGRAVRLALLALAVIPGLDAVLQIGFLGFIPPTAALIATSALTLLAAALTPRADPSLA